MKTFVATVIWPGKKWKAKGEIPENVSATLLPQGLDDFKENHIRVKTTKVDSDYAKRLLALKKGERVLVQIEGYYQKKPYFGLAELTREAYILAAQQAHTYGFVTIAKEDQPKARTMPQRPDAGADEYTAAPPPDLR